MTTTYDNLSDYDLFQLIDLDTKAHLEGSLAYTCENWSWDFDDPDLNDAFAEASDGDLSAIREALKATYERREQWWRDHPHPTQIGPLEAHEAEVARRARESAQ